jgi:BirA family biotin operon repressor/biotin-[acetyl-CoA-carboxylase] ligase
VSEAWPAGYGLRHFAELDSTNAEARRLAGAGAPAPLWIVADRQTQGRGRRGRIWEAPAGNLASTLLLRLKKPVAECAQLSFVAALAVADMVARYTPPTDVRVKWPNDVLVCGRKIAGILLESASNDGTRPDWLAVGIGINLATHPERTEFPATSLAALNCETPPARGALTVLARAWARWYDIWSEQGFEPVRDGWLVRAAGLGARIRARLGGGETSGVFEGIDGSGALLLREHPSRLRTISAGEVFF